MDKEEKEAIAWKDGIEELGLLKHDDEKDMLKNYMKEKKWKEASEFCRAILITASHQGKNTEEEMIEVVRKRYEEF